MLVDLILSGKKTLVIASNEEAERRAEQLLAEGADISVLTTDGPPSRKLHRLGSSGELDLPRMAGKNVWKPLMKDLRPFLAVISTGDARMDAEIARYARAISRLVYVVDRPQLNDLNMAAVARIGDIRIALSTGGLSPAMAGLLRRRIESTIGREDVLQIRLQGQIRGELKRSILDPSQRRVLIYRIMKDKKIFSLLKSDRFEDAKNRALSIIAATASKCLSPK